MNNTKTGKKQNLRTRLWKKRNNSIIPEYQLTPCGICMACRINRATQWADRLTHELEEWQDASFLTITYDDDHLPENGSLEKNEIKLFIKRLRFHWNKPIKYYICGEYGDNTLRPHYHGIFFGIGVQNLKYYGWTAWQKKCSLKNFHVDICIPETIRYTTKYIHKKLLGKKASEEYLKMKIEPPFALMSKGIGKNWAIKNADKIKQKEHLISDNGKPHGIPRYYRNLLDITQFNSKFPDETRQLEKIATQDQREKNMVQKSKLKRGTL